MINTRFLAQIGEKYHIITFRLISAAILIFLFLGSATAVCAQPGDSASVVQVGDLKLTLEDSLEAELNIVQNYQKRLERAQQEQVYFAAAANGYQLQLSAYGNLLLSSGVDISSLQKTRAEIKASVIEIQKMADELSPVSATLGLELDKHEQQKALVGKQVTELARIRTSHKSDDTFQSLEQTAKQLAATLKKKGALLAELDRIYQNRLTNLTEIQKAFSSLAAQFDDAVEQLKTKKLFERNLEAFRVDGLKTLKADIGMLTKRIVLISHPEYWLKKGQTLWQSAGLISISFSVVLFGVLTILIRIKRSVSGFQGLEITKKLGRWHRMTAALFMHSIIPGGLALTVFLYSRLDEMYQISSALEMISTLLLIFVAVKWVSRAFSTLEDSAFPVAADTGAVVKICRRAAVFIYIYVLMYYIIGRDSALLALFRITGSGWLLAWSLIFWRSIGFADLNTKTKPHDRKKLLLSLGSKYVLVIISGSALVLDMIGYGLLCVHWLVSWAKSGILVFWWSIFFKLIQEWDQYYREKSRHRREEFLYDDYPVQWLMIRTGQLIWLISFTVLFLLAWGNQQTVLGSLYQVLAKPISVGNMNFSLMGIVYAVFVLLITYALTRMWKWLFQMKFLNQSGMAAGLQDSITTITIYVIWMFGILVSLHVFGLNTASLAVAFGALGIGLGFGLQNIFNNFISGIILLVERPIQVGDDVEVNGIWATVKKINVRSTVVQTYDNASLIIPNADLISNLVTNWSFKDKRLRRNIEVGVAYGSDIELVRKTLLEIAEDTPKVLGYPKPDVIFRDFGDSALIFRLRIWTDIDNMWIAETHIRFNIDRLFRERGIEISFPQRDLHIRSIVDSHAERTKKTVVDPQKLTDDKQV